MDVAMGVTSSPVSGAAHLPPAAGLAAVASLRLLLETLAQLQVEHARMQGWSWQPIAEALGVSKQLVHKKYSGGRRRSGRP